MTPMPADPRLATCSRYRKEPQRHTYRDRNFWPDGKTRCIWCGKAKGQRFKRRAA